MFGGTVTHSAWVKTGKISIEPLYDDKGMLSSANTVNEETRNKITSGIFGSTESELRNMSSDFRYDGKYGNISVFYASQKPCLGYFDNPASNISLLVKDAESSSDNPSFHLKLYKHDNAMLNQFLASGKNGVGFFDELYSLTDIKSVSIKKESIPKKVLKNIKDENDAPPTIVFKNNVRFV